MPEECVLLTEPEYAGSPFGVVKHQKNLIATRFSPRKSGGTATPETASGP
jgi:hypothetical protein